MNYKQTKICIHLLENQEIKVLLIFLKVHKGKYQKNMKGFANYGIKRDQLIQNVSSFCSFMNNFEDCCVGNWRCLRDKQSWRLNTPLKEKQVRVSSTVASNNLRRMIFLCFIWFPTILTLIFI